MIASAGGLASEDAPVGVPLRSLAHPRRREAAALVARFVRTGGVGMLRMMNMPMDGAAHEAEGAMSKGPDTRATRRDQSAQHDHTAPEA